MFFQFFHQKYWKTFNFPIFSNIFQYFPICIKVFQFSNILGGLGPGPGQGQAQTRSKPGPRPFRILENWKTTIKIRNYWKLLEIIGKLKVFQYFLTKISENLRFSIISHMTRPKPGPEGPNCHAESWEIQLSAQLNLEAVK